MLATHVHHALAQVRELKLRILSAQRFTGYSGHCRSVGGTLALIAPLILTASWYPQTDNWHLLGWGVVLAVSVLANYSAVIYWFFSHPEVKRDVRRLMPAVDALPSLVVGAIITIALVANGHYDLLFGTWMCLFGLTNLSAKNTLPGALRPLGLAYIACGTACLLIPSVSFTSPWPMGLVFGIGEWIGGIIFHKHRMPDPMLKSSSAGETPND